MHAGALDVLHDARHEYRFSVADGVHLGLFAHQVFIDEDRVPGVELYRQSKVTF